MKLTKDASIKEEIKNPISYQDKATVKRKIIRKPSGTVTVFAFDREEGRAECRFYSL